MTASENVSSGEASLTASGIARLAGVGRAAVSNWRRRYVDFPSPIGGTAASPRFSAAAIDDWLRRQGRLGEADAGQWAWRHIESYQPAAHLGQVLGIAGAYLLATADQTSRAGTLASPKRLIAQLRHIDPELAERIRQTLPDEWSPQLSTVLLAVDKFAREQEPEKAFEYLHNQYVSSAQSMSGLATTPDTVAQVMLTLTGAGAHTFDFTCGTGSILRLAADAAQATRTEAHYWAQEINPEYALIAHIRLTFVSRRAPAGSPPPVIRVGSSLLADAFSGQQAEVVVANFPFGIHEWGHDQLVYDSRWVYGLPPRTEPELAWVQHGLAHLAPGGTAAFLMPPAAASRPAGRRIRAELIRRGALRAVVALPAGLMPPAGIGLHIWVLAAPDADVVPDGTMLFVDAAGAESLTECIGSAWASFRSGNRTDVPGVRRAVPVIELLDDQVDLTPQRHVFVPPDAADERHIAELTASLNTLVNGLRGKLPSVRFDGSATRAGRTHASLSDLIRADSVSVQLMSSRTGLRRSAGEVCVGDILVTREGRRISARVVAVASPSHVAPDAYLVRVDPTQFDPWFVAGALSSMTENTPTGRTSQNGAGPKRIDMRRLTLPIVPLAEQQRIGRSIRAASDFRAALEEATQLAESLAEMLCRALIAGVATPSTPDGW